MKHACLKTQLGNPHCSFSDRHMLKNPLDAGFALLTCAGD
ncbi:hypothetical protein HMPREF9370_0651 [Neisseria wadsworthii 9715]|uniref:Uncharacterized protein n=1 Tax=Neisseria wadsworthii 9715 TaxID=1030841 RepID=G4CNJ2_9NEIS|nr:hypothetical protein HMPREF9370_0651 [Neisseria wadsworthii 9715]